MICEVLVQFPTEACFRLYARCWFSLQLRPALYDLRGVGLVATFGVHAPIFCVVVHFQMEALRV